MATPTASSFLTVLQIEIMKLFLTSKSIARAATFVATAFLLSVVSSALTAQDKDSGSAQGEKDADYAVQGEYTGKLTIDGNEVGFGLQVIALGDGKFTGVGYNGGLPGDGWNGDDPERAKSNTHKDGEVHFLGMEGNAMIKDGKGKVVLKATGENLGTIARVERVSKTMGAKAPDGAHVLFSGQQSDKDNWEFKGKPGRITSDGLLMQGTASKKKFASHRLHIEFRLPYKPKARGQARGNSGIYLQGRYEVQMLDSFGLSGEQNECGGIYSIAKPNQNMCFPPLQWQTYDIEFHAAQFENGKKVNPAWMTVKHNGVTIHDKVKLPKSTTASPVKEGPEPGFVYLQNHGNEVRYRNIWVEELSDDEEKPDAEAPVRQSKESVKISDELTTEYWAYTPKNYDSKEKWPLMVFLHGAGERGDNMAIVKKHGPPKLVEQGKDFPFVLVSPQCKKGKRWHVEHLSKLLDEVESKYKVDKSKIYLTGLSMGGYGSWALAAHSPERFAAVAPICGGGDETTIPGKIGSKVPIWVFHGAKDKVVPCSQSEDLVKGFKDIGVEVQFTVYPEAGHDSWSETYDNPKLYKWFLSKSR